MIEGALILLGGIVLGRLLPGRNKTPKPPKPICGCDHHNALHDPKTGECHGTDREVAHYDTYGVARSWKQVPCKCRQYVGPKPIEEFFSTPMLPPGDS